MSIYNMLFGVEPTADIALKMLGNPKFPRFRDAYFTWEDEGKTDPVIVVHTRIGGNREDYEAEIDALTNLAGYRRDADCDYDRTYADFVFSVPEAEKEAVAEFLNENGKPFSSGEKFAAVLKSLKNSP